MKMEYQKSVNLFDKVSGNDLPRFFTKKWIDVYDQSGGNYSVSKETRMKKPMLMKIYVIILMHISLLKELLLLQIMQRE